MERGIDLIESIAKLSRRLRRRPQGEHPISWQEHRMLSTILREDGVRTTDLAARMDIRPASLTAVLKRLEGYGYIRRERGAKDSRVIHVYVTEKTRQEHAAHEAERSKRNERLLSCLTREEAVAFAAACEKLYVCLENESACGGCPGRDAPAAQRHCARQPKE